MVEVTAMYFALTWGSEVILFDLVERGACQADSQTGAAGTIVVEKQGQAWVEVE